MAVATPVQSQTPSRSLGDELRQLLRLGGPIALVQFGMTSLNFVDVAMLGHHDPRALPAMALGNTLVWGATMFCMGAVTALDPLLSQAVGAKDHEAIPRLLGRGLLLAVVLSLPAALLLMPAPYLLELCGQPPDLIPQAASYARLQAFAVLPFLWYTVLRSLLSAHARLLPQVLTILGGNLLNALLDWILVFGKLGLPSMGATGASLATLICRWLMFFGLVWLGRNDIMPHLRRLGEASVRASAWARGPLLRLLRLGTPIGAQFVLEMGVFAATALLIGNLDATTADLGNGNGAGIGGHQIALQLASLSFMVPLGLGMAASVRVGWAIGRGDQRAVRRSVTAALLAGTAVMTGFMLLFLLMPNALASLLSCHAGVLAVAVSLIPIAGVFQIGDGLQVVAIGCLRGLGDVRSPVIANVIGFWAIGLPLGCWLAFAQGHGPAGLWWGLVLGLCVVAASLLVVLRRAVHRQQCRLSID